MAHARGAPSNVDDEALDTVGELHVVPHADRPVGEQVQAGEQIRQRVLQGQRDGEATDAERGEERRDLHAERSEQDEAADDEHRRARGRLREARHRDGERPPLSEAHDQHADDVRGRERDREDDDGDEREIERVDGAGREMRDLDRRRDAGHEAPDQRRYTQDLEHEGGVGMAEPAAQRAQRDLAREEGEERDGDERDTGPDERPVHRE